MPTLRLLLPLLLLVAGARGRPADNQLMQTILDKIESRDAVIESQAAEIAQLRSLVEGLQASQRHTSVVAFSVTNDAGQRINLNDVVSFDHVEINRGNGYTAGSHTFTCPLTGVYQFSSSQMNTANSGGFGIFVNGVRIAADVTATGDWSHSSISVIVQCSAGHDVQVRCVRGEGCDVRNTATAYQDYARSTTFSGFLIYEG